MPGNEVIYTPKGGLCLHCASRYRDCSSLDFVGMPQIKRHEPDAFGIVQVIVRCTNRVPKIWEDATDDE